MKNTFQINIGLNTSNNNPVEIHRLLQDLRAAGLHNINSRIALGYWQGQPECTLVAECLFAIPLCHPEARLAIRVSIARIAEQHGQECIALLWPEGHGELVPSVGDFDPNQFRPVYPPEETPAPAPAPACDCAGDLRAVTCPTPDRRFFECITHDLGNIRDHAEEIGNAQACIIKEINSLLEIIRPLAITPARTPEVTSGW